MNGRPTRFPTSATASSNEQRKADEDKRAEDARRKAADARKSAQVNVKSSGPAGATPRTIDDTLQDIARRAYA
jgi:hypothetical protein